MAEGTGLLIRQGRSASLGGSNPPTPAGRADSRESQAVSKTVASTEVVGSTPTPSARVGSPSR